MSLLTCLDPTSVLVGGVGVLCVLWWLSTRRPPGLPPGPGPALPLLGHLHLLTKDPRPQFCTWRRQYGDVFSLYMGERLVVVLASYSAIHEALVNFADVFSNRPHTFMSKMFKNKGLSVTSGPTWKEQRKTTLEILRTMGMGKNVLADKMQEEITHYIRAIKDHQGAPVDLDPLTCVSISNNICSITMGTRHDYQDAEFMDFMELINRLVTLMPATGMVFALPFLRYLPGDPFRMSEFIGVDGSMMAFIKKHLEQHLKTLEENPEETEESTDFMYEYLRRMKKRRASGDVDSILHEEHLHRIAEELVAAGTETTSTAIQWTLLFFLHHPHVQDRCFQEISEVMGPHRPPSMSDRPQLTYLEATMWEVLRKGDIVPLSLQHATACDVTFRGYVIPKGAMVITSLSSVLQDPEIWGDPEKFRPERFIDSDGKLLRPEELIPFGIGRRVCLGKSIAQMELFLYLATLIQHFRFLPPEEGQLPSLEGVYGLTQSPQPYKIRAVPRM
ncbi:hypothetical protein ACOMHN_039153 [Nucella lapillus]